MSEIIRARDIVKRYGTFTAVDGISFSLRAGGAASHQGGPGRRAAGEQLGPRPLGAAEPPRLRPLLRPAAEPGGGADRRITRPVPALRPRERPYRPPPPRP